jgi:hypothetical protein
MLAAFAAIGIAAPAAIAAAKMAAFPVSFLMLILIFLSKFSLAGGLI